MRETIQVQAPNLVTSPDEQLYVRMAFLAYPDPYCRKWDALEPFLSVCRPLTTYTSHERSWQPSPNLAPPSL